jgi:[ribosomal protein S18]-alanine N-acetyltransferase
MILHLLDCCGDAAAVELAVHPDNDAARSLYGSLGFEPSRREENFFGDGEPRVIMVRTRRAQ